MPKKTWFLFYTAASIIPLYILAEAPSVTPLPVDDDHFFQEFVNMLTTLGLIVATIFFISWFLKRMVNARVQQANTVSTIKIVDRRALSPKSSLYLVEIYDKQILVGESAQGIQALGEFPFENTDKADEQINGTSEQAHKLS